MAAGGTDEPRDPVPARGEADVAWVNLPGIAVLVLVGGPPDGVRVESLGGVPQRLAEELAPGRSTTVDHAYRDAFDGELAVVAVPCDGEDWTVRAMPLHRAGSALDAPVERVVVTATTAKQADEVERELLDVERLSDVAHWDWRVAEDEVRWSPQLNTFYGVPLHATPRTYAEFRPYVHPDDLPTLEGAIQGALERPGPFSFEHRAVRSDGEVRLLSARGEVQVDAEGRPVRVLGTTQDVTSLRLTEAALRESEARFRQLAENLRSIVWLFDPVEGRFLYVNPAFEYLYQLPRDTLVADPYAWLGRIHPDDRPEVEQRLREAVEHDWTGYRVMHRIVWPDGTVRWLFAQTYPIRDADGHVVRIVGSGEDYTEQQAAAAALAESELRFRQIAENTHFMFWLQDTDTEQYLYVNPAYERIFGGRVQDMYDDPLAWLRHVHPDDRERVSAIPRGPSDEEYRIVGHRGDVRWVRARSFAVSDAAGRPYRRVGVVEDVTDRRLLQEQLLQSQKMEAVGRLAGGIAHDFNNLLFVILNYVEETLAVLPPDSDAADDLRRVVQAAERARSLTGQMLAFSRRQPATPTVMDVNVAVREAAAMLVRVLGEDVRIDVDTVPDLQPVRLDPVQFQQVLFNLAVNARDAMPGGGTLRLSTEPVSMPSLDDSAEPSPGVAVRVSDTGHGMSPDVAARAFEPFFTTKPVGQGTGLGLSSVFGIAEASGGHVSVDTEEDVGTTVTVLLPGLAGAPVESAEATTPGRTVEGRGRVALVVEDEEMVRRSLVRQLRRVGFVVHEATAGAEAIRMCQYSLWTVDLLVTDLVMPGLSGRELVRELAQLGLTPPVVYVSGYAGEMATAELHGERSRFLQKPFRAEQLLAAVEELDGAGSTTRPSASGSPS